MSLTTGKPPLCLFDESIPAVWQEMDIQICSTWKRFKETKCPGCGRPLSQHTENPVLGREETPEDYEVFSIECPAVQAIASGQEMWRQQNKAAIKSHSEGSGKDPSMGVYWVAVTGDESLGGE